MREEINHNDTQGKISAGAGSCKYKGPGVESHWCGHPGGHGGAGGEWWRLKSEAKASKH